MTNEEIWRHFFRRNDFDDIPMSWKPGRVSNVDYTVSKELVDELSKDLLNGLPVIFIDETEEEPFWLDIVDTSVSDPNQICALIISHAGNQYLVNTEGYSYARYVARIV